MDLLPVPFPQLRNREVSGGDVIKKTHALFSQTKCGEVWQPEPKEKQ